MADDDEFDDDFSAFGVPASGDASSKVPDLDDGDDDFRCVFAPALCAHRLSAHALPKF